jgi:hypothetical protein
MLVELVPKDAAARLAPIFMILLDGATVDARAFHNPDIARSVWRAAEAMLEHELASPPTLRKKKA